MCKWGVKEKTRAYKVFKVFYLFVWTQVLLSEALYWTLSLELLHEDNVKEKDTSIVRLIVLVYIPTIMMVLAYALLYY
jgi:hypothetical protein